MRPDLSALAPYLRRVLRGWIFLAIALGVTGVLPDIEWSAYDRVLREYRFLPVRFSWLGALPLGIHPSITLVADQGNQSEQESLRWALRQYRESQAGAVVLVGHEGLALGKEFVNSPLDTSPLYRVSPESHVPKDPKPGHFVVKYTGSQAQVRDFYLALKGPDGPVPSLPLMLYARFLGADESLTDLRYQSGRLVWDQQSIPVWQDQHGYLMPILTYLKFEFLSQQIGEATVMVDRMVPIRLDRLREKNPDTGEPFYFGPRCLGKFVFFGDFGGSSAGERMTPTGTTRDFQLIAQALDSLIQGPQVRRLDGWALVLFYLSTAAALVLWFQTPTTLMGQFVRLGLTSIGLHILSIGLLTAGFYAPVAWLYLYLLMLTGWSVGRVWLRTIQYLRRYGGSSAAALLLGGETNLDHAVAEERQATVVFLGLPDHLRELERLEDSRILSHRQLFSERVARITHQFGGIVHDFQADYLMLGFGTHPGRVDSRHAHHAFMCAQHLVGLKAELARKWKLEEAVGARLQVSVNTGQVAVGWVGTQRQKRASAAIGDTTNVAARLLGTAKKMNLDMVVSESTFQQLQGSAHFEALPPVMLKGKTEAVHIYRWVPEL